MSSYAIDPVFLAQRLIQFPSVTPENAGCLDFIEDLLRQYGFKTQRFLFGLVDNLYARRGTTGRNFCFAGHVDVVPVGDLSSWVHPPFSGEIVADKLYGRGAVDMKGAIAAFFAAVLSSPSSESISLLLTCDEEGPAIDGTAKVLKALKAQDETIDVCLVGEPTSEIRVGDMIKVGRRGSLNLTIQAKGLAGHTAYHHLAQNPIPLFLKTLLQLVETPLDKGAPHFQPSHLEIVSINVDNPAFNVIPDHIKARINIRFNPTYSRDSLFTWVQSHLPPEYEVVAEGGCEAFYSPHPWLSELVSSAITSVTGLTPQITTNGGTSDARFIKDICPTIECGLSNAMAHKANECVPLAELHELTQIYQAVLTAFFLNSAQD